MSAPTFEIVTTRLGAISIRDNVTGETMHNPVGPWAEANSLYIEQSHLRKRLTENTEQELVIFDVGLGAAANALATLHCAAEFPQRRPLKMISFERNLDLLRFALENAKEFAHFKGYESAIQTLLEEGRWTSQGLIWELRHGDFLKLIDSEQEKAHLVFYDPYSYKKNSEMWSTDIFREVRRLCVNGADEGALLMTYSRATPIRVAMLRAGFYVGTGFATGAKEETTQAATRLQDLEFPLGKEWLARWKGSHTPNAAGATAEELPAVQEFILNHPQFT